MKITGELLKSERIKLKLSQQDIAFALKLSPRIINAIEEGDVESLPARTFVRGFVKSYAEMLKLDSNMVLNQYHEEMGISQPTAKVITLPSENAKAKNTRLDDGMNRQENISSVTPNLKMNLNRNTFKIAFLITLAVIFIGGINQLVSKYQKEGVTPELPKLSVETLTQEANIPKEAPPEVIETPGVVATTTSAEQVSTPTNASTPIPPPSGSAVPPTAQKEPVIEKPATEKPIVAEKPAAPTPPTPAETEKPTPPPATSGKSIELVLEAVKDTTVSYATGADGKYKTINLKKDSIQIIKSKTGLHLKIDEGNAISITVNGISRGMASSNEKPLELSF